MRVGSLFSGIGGIEIGFERAGFETEWFVENEPYAQAILKKRFPNAKIYGDIKEIDFGTIPKVEILTGGFPCQDISNAGKGVGIEGSRSSLWKYYLKAIREIRPKIAFIENVSALLNRGLNVVLADLAQIRYDAEWYCVSASSIGANHQRNRIFIIAYEQNPMADSNFQRSRKGFEELRITTKSEIENKDRFGRNDVKSSSADVANSAGDGCEKSGEVKGGFDSCCKEGGLQQFERGSLSENVSNTNEKRLERKHESEHRGRKSEEEFGCRGSIVSNSQCVGLECSRDEGSLGKESKEEIGREWSESSERPEEFSSSSSTGRRERESLETDWSVEPNVGRVAHGVSFRVDRIKCLGNAVVPQLAEVFAKAIRRNEEGIKNDGWV